jgi:hypothetical protein
MKRKLVSMCIPCAVDILLGVSGGDDKEPT